MTNAESSEGGRITTVPFLPSARQRGAGREENYLMRKKALCSAHDHANNALFEKQYMRLISARGGLQVQCKAFRLRQHSEIIV